MYNTDPKEIHIVTAQSRLKNPDIRLTQYFLSLASFPEDCPITMAIFDGKIEITYVPNVTH